MHSSVESSEYLLLKSCSNLLVLSLTECPRIQSVTIYFFAFHFRQKTQAFNEFHLLKGLNPSIGYMSDPLKYPISSHLPLDVEALLRSTTLFCNLHQRKPEKCCSSVLRFKFNSSDDSSKFPLSFAPFWKMFPSSSQSLRHGTYP